MPETFAHCALVNVASVAITPIVVASPGPSPNPGPAAAARSRAAARSALDTDPREGNSPGSPKRAAYNSPVSGSTQEPTALTTISAATVVPSGRTADADPTPPLRPPARAPVPAPTHPCWTGPSLATTSASLPMAASGRLPNDPPRPRSKITAAGTIGTTSPGPPTGNPTPAEANRTITPSAAASPNADPPDRTTAWTRSTMLRGSSRSVSRVPGPPPRTSTPPTAPPSGASTTVVPVSQPSPMRVA